MDSKLLAAFTTHGFVPHGNSGDQYYGQCPFCTRAKLYVSEKTGQWDCKHGECGKRGNLYSFLRQVWEAYREETTKKELQDLAKDRGLKVETLKEAGLAFNGVKWLLPIFNERKSLVQLRHFYIGRPLFNTTGVTSGLFGMEQLEQFPNDTVWVCEGEWDALALREMLKDADEEAPVIAAPGAAVWKNTWTPHLAGRQVNIVYDNDRAGRSGQEKLQFILQKTGADVRVIEWPEGTDEGFDVRDLHNSGGTLDDLRALLQVTADSRKAVTVVKKVDGFTFQKALDVYEEHLCVDEEMERAIALAYSVVLSNRIAGDPVWMFLVAPPGGSKTEILMSLLMCPEAIVRSTLTPHSLVSGFRTPDGADPSLIPQLNGKVFVLKDFTEVQQMHPTAKDEVYSVLRGAYDGRVEKTFGNGVVRSYECHFSMLAGATHHIQADRSTALGERFLMYKFREQHDSQATIIRAAMSNVGVETTVREALQTAAVTYFANKTVGDGPLPTLDAKWVDPFVSLAQLVALLRAEVAKDNRKETVLYRPQTEVGTRLAKQLKKLAIALALLHDRKKVGAEEFRLVKRVGLDTCTGWDLEVVKSLAKAADLGMTLGDLVTATRIPQSTLREKILDMELLGLVQAKMEPNKAGRGAPARRYWLHKTVRTAWDNIGGAD